MTKREVAIITIAGLYPTDSDWEDTNKIGCRLLDQAKKNTTGWRYESDEVLFEYARLCKVENEKMEVRI